MGSFLTQLELLYRRMIEAGVSKLELEIGPQEKLRLTRKGAQAPSASPAQAASAFSAAPASEIPGMKITAPLSGVFYRAPSPSSPMFVEEGSGVRPGDVLCIIEAMKVMNEIKAAKAGRVLKISGVNGKHVKKGDVLFILGE
ncbi:MAG: acetyl-CoA carboxylase biotin carboxyl carrier protein [Elusimicrobia bacterium]|nr:acetyl-CoA carboxylase biotin carboxyl carrier protein [Elusimicrobiota bacterium]